MASAFQDPRAHPTCEHCGNETEDIRRCSVQDNKNLCDGCFQDLPGARRDDIGDPEWVCENHLDRKVEVFCKTCKCGYCMECARDDHKDDDVVNVQELAQEIREDLLTQLQWVHKKTEKLSELQVKIRYSVGKAEEARMFVDKIVNEIKNEIEQMLEEEVQRIYLESNRKIEQLKEKARLKRQRIEQIHQDWKAGFQKDEEKRKLQQMEKKLTDDQRACNRAKEEIKTVLESNPEKIINQGTQLSCLVNKVKTSTEFQCKKEVDKYCRKVEAKFPQMEEAKHDFHNSARPFTLLVKIALCMLVILYEERSARVDNGLEFIRHDFDFFIYWVSFGFKFRNAYAGPLDLILIWTIKCLILGWILLPVWEYDYPFKWKRSFMTKFIPDIISYQKLMALVFEYVAFTILFLCVVSSPFFLKLAIVNKNTFSIISILHSCSSILYMLMSKRCKDFCYYARLNKL